MLGKFCMPRRPVLELLVVPVLTAPSPEGAGRQSQGLAGEAALFCMPLALAAPPPRSPVCVS